MNIAKKVYDATNRMGLLNLLSDKMYTGRFTIQVQQKK